MSLLASTGSTAAMASTAPASPINGYLQARAADAGGLAREAAAGYAAALDAAPDDAILAARAFRQAMAAGDDRLALRAALVLDKAKVLPSDARLILMTDAVRRRDWTAARLQVDRIETEGAFDFLVPVMRAWIMFGAQDGDPVALLDANRNGALAGAYAAEHRALLLAARGKIDDSVTAVRASALLGGNRTTALRLAVAAQIAKLGKREQALSLLEGGDSTITAAHARLAAGRDLPGAVDDAAAGLSVLLLRLAGDIARERLSTLSISLARNALLLTPESSAAQLAMSGALSGGGYTGEALELLARVAADDPLAPAAQADRILLMQRTGDIDGALKAAEQTAAAPGALANDLARLGDIRAQAGDHQGAARAFGQAIARVEANGEAVPWSLYLLLGSAYERAGDWEKARPVLQKAAALAPDNAVVLNHLGYAQLERGENVDAATRLVARASALRPDDPAITDSLGWAYYLRGDLPKAIETLERAVKGEPSESAINEHLGDAYWAAGRRFEARYAWRSALIFAEGDSVSRLRTKIDTGPAPKPR